MKEDEGTVVVDLLKTGVPSKSGRVYPREVVEKALAEFGDKVCIVVPNSMDRDHLADALALADMELEDDTLKGRIKPLDIPSAISTVGIRSLLDAGRIRFAPRGRGTVLNGVVQSDYKITSVGMILRDSPLGEDDGHNEES